MIEKIVIGTLEIGMNSNYTLRRGIQGLEMFTLQNEDERVPQSFVTRRVSNWGVGRVVTFPVTIKGSNINQIIQNRQNLSQALYPSQGQLVTILIHMQNDVVYRLDGYLESFDAPMDARRLNIATIAIKCDDSRIFSQSTNSQDVGVLGIGGGVEIPTEVPFSIGSGGSTSIVTNTGNTEASPTFIVRGPGTNFLVQNLTTGKAFRIGRPGNDFTLTSSQEVRVDTIKQSVLQAGLNRSSFFSGDFFTINPGSNEIAFTAESGETEETKVTVQWRDAFLGL